MPSQRDTVLERISEYGTKGILTQYFQIERGTSGHALGIGRDAHVFPTGRGVQVGDIETPMIRMTHIRSSGDDATLCGTK